ncbi:MAG: phosphosulfolactate synthase, partial [Bacteroidia bacterium]
MNSTYNYQLPNLPDRSAKPRNMGLTMVMDKGLSLREVEDFLSMTQEYVDIVKLGFGTSIITPNLKEKIDLYRQAGIPVYFGGTLFEAFVKRGKIDDYRKFLDKYDITHLEVSDGSIEIPQDEKCGYISSLAKDYTVLSEV